MISTLNSKNLLHGLTNRPSKRSVFTEIPGREPIELVAYYDSFVNYYPRCEMLTKKWFVENVEQDWVILDCGANIGYYAILFAQLAPKGHVYAFEPTNTIEMLRQNLHHNNVQNVTCVRAALGNKVGDHTDKIYRIWGQEPDEGKYPFTTIDEFVRTQHIDRVDCIKIDVDSFDFEVLQGAQETLREFNPFVMVELNHALNKRKQSNIKALEWLAKQGYEECVVFEHENFLLKKGYRYRGRKGRLCGLRVLFAEEQSVEALHGSRTDPAESEAVAQTDFQTKPRHEIAGSDLFEWLTQSRETAEQAGQITIPSVPVEQLHTELGFKEIIDYPESSLNKPLEQWKMEVDDSPIFRYIYRNFRPERHLEFGTWQGQGALYCLEECDATVWTINLLKGERWPDGRPAYTLGGHDLAAVQNWANKMGLQVRDCPNTDSFGYIGRLYLDKNLGTRVCQIYCDSPKWDISNYPSGFFDTVLIDGGHQADIVIPDTAKAFKLVRSGGLIMWHDFCPPIYDKFPATRGVMEAIHASWEWINQQTSKLFWIYPSQILLGVKK